MPEKLLSVSVDVWSPWIEMTYVVPKSKPKMILGVLGFGCGGAFTWLAFFFLGAGEAPGVAMTLEIVEALDTEPGVQVRLAGGLELEAVLDRLRELAGASSDPTSLSVSGV